MSQLHTRLEQIRRPALAAYVVVVLFATLVPFRADFDTAHMAERLMRAFIPNFRRSDIVDAARNIVLFGGWGLVWMATAPRGGAWRSARRATGWGAVLSAFVELCQVGSTNRFPSINDVATNTLGSFLGAISFAAVVYTLYRSRDRKSYFGLPAAVLAVCYGTSAFLEATVPFFRNSLGRIQGGFSLRIAIILSEFQWSSILKVPWEDFVLFAPAGGFAVMALVESGMPHRRAAGWVAAVGTVLALVAELIHAPIGIPIVLGSIVAHCGGVCLGALIASRWLPLFSQHVRGPDRPRILATAYTALMVCWAWRPYLPELSPAAWAAKLRLPWWIPLAMTGRWNEVYSVVDVAVPFFLGVPAGAVLAVWPLRRSGPLRTALPAIYLALILEAGQLFLVGRDPSITDFLVAGAGIVMGWLCLRRAGFQPYGELLAGPKAASQ